MASAHPFLVFLCFCSINFWAHGGDEQNFMVVPTTSFRTGSICSTPRVAPRLNRTSLLLTHRNGPCCPSRPQNKPSFLETLRQDQLRANYIQSRISASVAQQQQQQQQLRQSDVSVPTNIGYSIGTLQYVITVSYGTPPVPQTVEIDTGSDVSWIQCNPCPVPPCYSQKDPLFDPNKSSTYSAISCSAAACSQLSIYADGCLESQCQYIVSYGDGSNTTGVYSYDTLTLTSSDVVSNFQFGCGHDDEGLFKGIDGLMGLGRQPQSLVSQAYGGAFSYCLPPSPSSAGFLTLGAQSGTSGFAVTPLNTLANAPTFYVVVMTGISVGGQQLNVPASVFSGGTVVDSGTVITRLPPTAYAALRSAFQSAMTNYPTAQQSGILDTCYDFRGYNSVTLPTIALTFSGGATMNLDASGILSGGCLAFAANAADGDLGILGNVQQRTFEVSFDVSATAIGFRPGAC